MSVNMTARATMSHRITRTLQRWMLPAALLVAAATCRCIPHVQPEPRKVDVAAIVLDQSPSTTITSRCQEMAARIHQYQSRRGIRRLEVAVYGTGETREPKTLIPWTRWEVHYTLHGGRAAAEGLRADWIARVEQQCQAALRGTNSSPIFTAISRAVDGIRAHCASLREAGEECSGQFLAVHSDLRETTERSVAQRLYQPKSKVKLPTIDTTGLSVSVCGVSNTTGPDDLTAPDLLQKVWQEVLQTATSFDPSCPGEGTTR